MEPNPATDAVLVKLELISRHLLRLGEELARELARVDDEISELMFALSGVSATGEPAGLEEPFAEQQFAAWSATLERVGGLADRLVAAGS